MAEGLRSMEIGEYDLYTAGDRDSRSRLADWKHLNFIMDRPNLLLEEDLYTAGEERPKPSAPLDIGKLMIKVDWTEAFPDRWRARLQIALQTWLSKLEENATVHSIKLMNDPSFAEVQITPSTALEALKKLKFIPLWFKNENKDVAAWICQDEATYVNEPQKSLLEENRATLLEDIYTAGDENPPAPLDIGKYKIQVDWAEAFPDRWRARLQIALQIWLSKLEEAPVIHSIKLMDDPSCAEVLITPATPLEVLKNHTATPLKFKYYEEGKQKKVTARIYLDEPHTFLPEKIRAPLQQVNKAVSGTSEEANKVEDIAACNKSQTETNKTAKVTPETSSQLILPLHLSWYIYNAYQNELESIGKRHGVTFFADVSISIRPAENPGPDYISKATEDFQKLAQGCADSFSYARVHHNDMDSEIVKNTIESIKSQKTKLMFTLTESNGLFLGPKKFTDMIEEKTRREETQSKNRAMPTDVDAYPIDEDSSFPPQSRPSLHMSTQDLPTQLEMDKVHWDLMKLSCEEQLSELEAKYGVSFNADLQKNVVKVQARSKGVQHVNLEGHAVRALTHLYQKLASAAVSCELRKSADQTDVSSAVEKLQQRYCVVAAERLSRWRLAGLPEHLGPAIAETEKILQRKVFDEEMTKSIGYSENTPYSRGTKIELMPDYGARGAGGPKQDERVNPKSKHVIEETGNLLSNVKPTVGELWSSLHQRGAAPQNPPGFLAPPSSVLRPGIQSKSKWTIEDL
ncbi:uncharacterized protein dtex3lb.1 isoform X2 [Danio aesculapii]|uniref:uncharacterized protein dtex3lb.1 isoform X2 n=1 Tax=Danio aesculapii TaxID=1142201 RepID=UPI0024C0177C|nr:uncharacterized protein dtex3lb.1 isoform X2 [Danio aesculapii]